MTNLFSTPVNEKITPEKVMEPLPVKQIKTGNSNHQAIAPDHLPLPVVYFNQQEDEDNEQAHCHN